MPTIREVGEIQVKYAALCDQHNCSLSRIILIESRRILAEVIPSSITLDQLEGPSRGRIIIFGKQILTADHLFELSELVNDFIKLTSDSPKLVSQAKVDVLYDLISVIAVVFQMLFCDADFTNIDAFFMSIIAPLHNIYQLNQATNLSFSRLFIPILSDLVINGDIPIPTRTAMIKLLLSITTPQALFTNITASLQLDRDRSASNIPHSAQVQPPLPSKEIVQHTKDIFLTFLHKILGDYLQPFCFLITSTNNIPLCTALTQLVTQILALYFQLEYLPQYVSQLLHHSNSTSHCPKVCHFTHRLMENYDRLQELCPFFTRLLYLCFKALELGMFATYRGLTAKSLAGLPPALQYITFNGLPLPSSATNVSMQSLNAPGGPFMSKKSSNTSSLGLNFSITMDNLNNADGSENDGSCALFEGILAQNTPGNIGNTTLIDLEYITATLDDITHYKAQEPVLYYNNINPSWDLFSNNNRPPEKNINSCYISQFDAQYTIFYQSPVFSSLLYNILKQSELTYTMLLSHINLLSMIYPNYSAFIGSPTNPLRDLIEFAPQLHLKQQYMNQITSKAADGQRAAQRKGKYEETQDIVDNTMFFTPNNHSFTIVNHISQLNLDLFMILCHNSGHNLIQIYYHGDLLPTPPQHTPQHTPQQVSVTSTQQQNSDDINKGLKHDVENQPPTCTPQSEPNLPQFLLYHQDPPDHVEGNSESIDGKISLIHRFKGVIMMSLTDGMCYFIEYDEAMRTLQRNNGYNNENKAQDAQIPLPQYPREFLCLSHTIGHFSVEFANYSNIQRLFSPHDNTKKRKFLSNDPKYRMFDEFMSKDHQYTLSLATNQDNLIDAHDNECTYDWSFLSLFQHHYAFYYPQVMIYSYFNNNLSQNEMYHANNVESDIILRKWYSNDFLSTIINFSPSFINISLKFNIIKALEANLLYLTKLPGENTTTILQQQQLHDNDDSDSPIQRQPIHTRHLWNKKVLTYIHTLFQHQILPILEARHAASQNPPRVDFNYNHSLPTIGPHILTFLIPTRAFIYHPLQLPYLFSSLQTLENLRRMNKKKAMELKMQQNHWSITLTRPEAISQPANPLILLLPTMVIADFKLYPQTPAGFGIDKDGKPILASPNRSHYLKKPNQPQILDKVQDGVFLNDVLYDPLRTLYPEHVYLFNKFVAGGQVKDDSYLARHLHKLWLISMGINNNKLPTLSLTEQVLDVYYGNNDQSSINISLNDYESNLNNNTITSAPDISKFDHNIHTNSKINNHHDHPEYPQNLIPPSSEKQPKKSKNAKLNEGHQQLEDELYEILRQAKQSPGYNPPLKVQRKLQQQKEERKRQKMEEKPSTKNIAGGQQSIPVTNGSNSNSNKSINDNDDNRNRMIENNENDDEFVRKQLLLQTQHQCAQSDELINTFISIKQESAPQVKTVPTTLDNELSTVIPRNKSLPMDLISLLSPNPPQPISKDIQNNLTWLKYDQRNLDSSDDSHLPQSDDLTDLLSHFTLSSNEVERIKGSVRQLFENNQISFSNTNLAPTTSNTLDNNIILNNNEAISNLYEATIQQQITLFGLIKSLKQKSSKNHISQLNKSKAQENDNIDDDNENIDSNTFQYQRQQQSQHNQVQLAQSQNIVPLKRFDRQLHHNSSQPCQFIIASDNNTNNQDEYPMNTDVECNHFKMNETLIIDENNDIQNQNLDDNTSHKIETETIRLAKAFDVRPFDLCSIKSTQLFDETSAKLDGHDDVIPQFEENLFNNEDMSKYSIDDILKMVPSFAHILTLHEYSKKNQLLSQIQVTQEQLLHNTMSLTQITPPSITLPNNTIYQPTERTTTLMLMESLKAVAYLENIVHKKIREIIIEEINALPIFDQDSDDTALVCADDDYHYLQERFFNIRELEKKNNQNKREKNTNEGQKDHECFFLPFETQTRITTTNPTKKNSKKKF